MIIILVFILSSIFGRYVCNISLLVKIFLLFIRPLSLSLSLSCTLLFYFTIFALLPFMQFLTLYLVLLFVILTLLLSLF